MQGRELALILLLVLAEPALGGGQGGLQLRLVKACDCVMLSAAVHYCLAKLLVRFGTLSDLVLVALYARMVLS